MIDDQALFITQLLTLWAVLDPISHLPLFMTATAELDAAEKRRAASASVLMAFAVLAVFGFAGQYLLHAMGVSLLSFQIAGGITLMLFALSMVLGQHGPQQAATLTVAEGPSVARISAMSVAVYPLATPIIAGPGSMLSILVLMDNNRFSAIDQAVTMAALVVALTALLAVFVAGQVIERAIGQAGIQLLRRVMGLLLSALAVNLVLNAVATWLKLPPI
jgi:multiple antibiotic resistance protein